MKLPAVQELEKEHMKNDIPEFAIGDTIRVYSKIVEEGGKERLQSLSGTVIARKGSGVSETITIHRVAYGEGMARVFFIHSPLVAKIEVEKRGQVRRSKLYYLRGKSGKAAKVKGRIVKAKAEAEAGA